MKPNIIFEKAITDAGGTDTLSYSEGYTAANLYTSGAVTLLGDYSINFSGGTAVDGEEFEVHCNLTQLTLGGFTCSVMGYSVPQAVLSAGPFIVKVTIINNAKIVTVIPSFSGSQYITSTQLAANAVTTNKVTDNAVTYAKIQDFAARGYLLRGGTAGEPEGFNAVTSGNLVMGNGTDVVSQAVTGDVTIDGSGVTTIGAGKVTASMLNFTINTELTTTLSLSSTQILALNTSPQTIVAAPGANKIIVPKHCIIKYTYSTAAYATNTTLELINEGGTISILEDTTALIGTVSKNVPMKPTATGATAGQTQALANSPLQIKVRTGDPTAGSGTIKIFLTYYIQDIS